MISTCGVEEEVQDHKDQVQNEEVEVEVVRLKSKLVVEVKLLRACAVLQAGLLVAGGRRLPSSGAVEPRPRGEAR